jgi:uncharacterized membrane protein
MSGPLPERTIVAPGRLEAVHDATLAATSAVLVVAMGVPTEIDLADPRRALHALGPRVVAVALTYGVLAAQWLRHQEIVGWLRRTNGAIVGLNLLTLGTVAALALPAALLGRYGATPIVVASYAANLLAISVGSFLQLAWLRRDKTVAKIAYTEAVFRDQLPMLAFVNTACLAAIALSPAAPSVAIAILVAVVALQIAGQAMRG